MKFVMCSVFDVVANQYGRPFCAISEATAIRSFAAEVNRPAEDSMLFNNPKDFRLCVVGFFDDAIGVLEPCAPRSLADGINVVNHAGNRVASAPLKEVSNG